MLTENRIDRSYLRRVSEDEYQPLSGVFTAQRIYLLATVICQPGDEWYNENYSGWLSMSSLIPSLWAPYCEDSFDLEEDEPIFLDQQDIRYAVWGRRFLETQIGLLSEQQRMSFHHFSGSGTDQSHACFGLATSLIEQVKDLYDQPFQAPTHIRPGELLLLSCLVSNARLQFHAAEKPYIKLECYADISPRLVRI